MRLTSDRKRLHLVGQNKIVKFKKEGGLGIQAARAKNIALLTRLNWRLYYEQDANQVGIILKKYCFGSRAKSSNPDSLPSSPNWKAIKAGFPVFLKGVCQGIGDGSRVRFWSDSWIKGESLRELIEGPLNQGEIDLTVAGLRNEGRWNWEVASFVFPEDITDKIKAIPIRSCGVRSDFIMLKASKDGEFTFKSTYQLARQKEIPGNVFQSSWIWKLDILPKITHFLWLSFHGSIPVHGVLVA